MKKFEHAKAQHEKTRALAKMLEGILEGKDKTALQILMKSDDLSTRIMAFGGTYADPRNTDDFSEHELNDVLEYLDLVEDGLQQFIDSRKEGADKNA